MMSFHACALPSKTFNLAFRYNTNQLYEANIVAAWPEGKDCCPVLTSELEERCEYGVKMEKGEGEGGRRMGGREGERKRKRTRTRGEQEGTR